ncbi:MAG: hypothetical protein ACRETL_03070 [Gammaproteobacteria bacterium]
MTTTESLLTSPAKPAEPSWGWAARRSLLLLTIMFSVTGIATLIAYASIDNATDTSDQNPLRIEIGMPAAHILKHDAH